MASSSHANTEGGEFTNRLIFVLNVLEIKLVNLVDLRVVKGEHVAEAL